MNPEQPPVPVAITNVPRVQIVENEFLSEMYFPQQARAEEISASMWAETMKFLMLLPTGSRFLMFSPFLISAISPFIYGLLGNSSQPYGVNKELHQASWVVVGSFTYYMLFLFWLLWNGISHVMRICHYTLIKLGIAPALVLKRSEKMVEMFMVVLAFQAMFIWGVMSYLTEGVGGQHFVYVMFDIKNWICR